MDYVGRLINNTVQDSLKPERVIMPLIEKEMADYGINLSDDQRNQLEQQLNKTNDDALTIEFTNEQRHHLEQTTGQPDKLEIDLDKAFDDDKIESAIRDAIDNAVPKVLNHVADKLVEAWKSQAPKLIKQQNREHKRFSKLLGDIWGEPLQLLEVLHGVSLDAGSDFNETERPSAVRDGDFAFETLTRLHARGCQIGQEILILLHNGMADGAYARWRTLHELAVTAMFIEQHGQDMAESYLDHAAVTNYKEALTFQKHCQDLGKEPLTEAEIRNLKLAHDETIDKYGASFKEIYGWAAQSLGKKKPTFLDIEHSTGLEHMRPFYKAANLNIHAGSKAALFRFGTPIDGREILLAGRSIYGLAEIGQNTAVSINQLTTTLLLSRPNFDRLAFVMAAQELVSETFWSFEEKAQRLRKAVASLHL
jgi:hypothetical protein